MHLIPLIERPELASKRLQYKRYESLGELLEIIQSRSDIPEDSREFINQKVQALNEIASSDKAIGRAIRKCRTSIIQHLVKELKLVPKYYHRNSWLAVGMGAFGIPIGVAISTSMGNMSYIGVGIPIGMAIGIGFGSQMDKKAADEGRQLEIEA